MTAAHMSTQSATLIGSRRAQSLAAARRRTRFVAGLRLFLGAAAAAVALNALVEILLSGRAYTPGEALTPAGQSERIINPRFTGRDESGAPFVITADTAERRTEGLETLTDLERPALDYALLERAAEASQVLAQRGVFNERAQTLALNSQVRLTTRSGYIFRTEAATLHLREGRVTGDQPVFGLAPWGAVRADAFEVRDDGREIALSGDVRTRFFADVGPASPAATGSEETQP